MIKYNYFKDIAKKQSAMHEITKVLNTGHFLPMLFIGRVVIQKYFYPKRKENLK